MRIKDSTYSANCGYSIIQASGVTLNSDGSLTFVLQEWTGNNNSYTISLIYKYCVGGTWYTSSDESYFTNNAGTYLCDSATFTIDLPEGVTAVDIFAVESSQATASHYVNVDGPTTSYTMASEGTNTATSYFFKQSSTVGTYDATYSATEGRVFTMTFTDPDSIDLSNVTVTGAKSYSYDPDTGTYTVTVGTSDIAIIFDVNTYELKYDLNGGSAPDGSEDAFYAVTCDYGSNVTISSVVPERDGYEFTEWNTSSNGSGTSYASGKTINNLIAPITLYAQWSITTPITITADSASKTYDGTALTAGYTYTTGVLVTGDVLTAVVEGSQTDAGSSVNTVTSYKVMRGETNVTLNYTFEESVAGTLTVTKSVVTVTVREGYDHITKVYDGKDTVDTTLVLDTHYTVSATGKIPMVLNSSKTYASANAGNPNNITANFTLSDTSNYEFAADKDKIVLTNASITKASYDMSGVTFVDASKTYTGSAQSLTVGGTLPTGYDGIQVTVSYEGSATDVSEGAVTVTATFATASTNYNVPLAMTAKITITEAPLTIKVSDSKVYNGTVLTYTLNGSEAAGLVNGESVEGTVITTVSSSVGTYTVPETEFAVEFPETFDYANYDITYDVSLVIRSFPTPVTPDTPTVTYYDVTAIYDDEFVTVTGIPSSGEIAAGSSLTVTITGAVNVQSITVSVTMGGSSVSAFTYSEDVLNAGTVTIDSVSGDVVITVSYETVPTETLAEEAGFPWWILLVLLFALLLLIILLYKRRKDDEDEEEQFVA